MDRLLVNSEIVTSTIEVPAGETLNLRLANFEEFKDCKIMVNVGENAAFDCAFADFSSGNGKFQILVNLCETGANCQFRSSVLSNKTSRKTVDVSIMHCAHHTFGKMENYGICEDESRLIFTGVSEVKKGCYKSVTRQSAKIIVFDDKCLGRASPILNIDENDVQASHAAVVGKLNDDHLFYLMSRGLDIDQARRLITLGYLKPISEFFVDEIKDKINEAIEGGI